MYILGDKHYGTVPICRVPRAHGKGRFTLGKKFAECNTRQTTAGKELVCRVLHLGHTANTLPCAILAPRQNKVHWQTPRGTACLPCAVTARHTANTAPLPCALSWHTAKNGGTRQN